MDGPLQQGAELFAGQLRAKGTAVVVDGDWVEFDFEVPGGTYAGAVVRMGIQVPGQFPTAPPGGIDFKPRQPGRPLNTGAEHPQRSHSSRRYGDAGEYWSRPHTTWNSEQTKNASAYMAWVRHLWLTT
jgi:hypothetical protein